MRTLLVSLSLFSCSQTPYLDDFATQKQRLWPQKKIETLDLSSPPGLAAYLRQARAANPGLKAAFENWRAARARAHASGWLPEPKLTWAHFVETLETRTGPQRNRFSLMQGIPWFGKPGLKRKAAKFAARILLHQVEQKLLDLDRQVINAWAEYRYLGQALAINAEMVALLKGLEPVVQRRIQAGKSQGDLLRLQLEIGSMENRLASLKNQRPALTARLWALMGRQSDRLLPWPRPPAGDQIKPLPKTTELKQQLLSTNPELRIAQEKIARAQILQDLANLAGYPDLSLSATLFETGSSSMAGVADSGNDPLALGLTLTLPLWSEKYKAQRLASQAGLDMTHYKLSQNRNTLAARLAALRFKVEDRARQAQLYARSLLPRAQQALVVTTRAYQTGTATLLDLVDRQQVLLSFRLAWLRARTDHRQNLADLTALCGGELR